MNLFPKILLLLAVLGFSLAIQEDPDVPFEESGCTMDQYNQAIMPELLVAQRMLGTLSPDMSRLGNAAARGFLDAFIKHGSSKMKDYESFRSSLNSIFQVMTGGKQQQETKAFFNVLCNNANPACKTKNPVAIDYGVVGPAFNGDPLVNFTFCDDWFDESKWPASADSFHSVEDSCDKNKYLTGFAKLRIQPILHAIFSKSAPFLKQANPFSPASLATDLPSALSLNAFPKSFPKSPPCPSTYPSLPHCTTMNTDNVALFVAGTGWSAICERMVLVDDRCKPKDDKDSWQSVTADECNKKCPYKCKSKARSIPDGRFGTWLWEYKCECPGKDDLLT